MANRKAFNFYASYFEIAEHLNDKDRLAWYDALMNRQFNGIEPELKGQALFAYISQKHSIDAQIKGFEDKTKEKITPLHDPYQGGTVGGEQGPSVQEKGKEKGKVKVKGKDEEQLVTLIYPFDSDDFKNCWSTWIKYKKDEHKFSYKKKETEQVALKQLSEISKGIEKDAIAIIQQSIANGYKGLFALKNQNPKKTETFQERIEDRIDVMQQARALVQFDENGNMID